MVKKINPASDFGVDFGITCIGSSFMQSSGNILSLLAKPDTEEVIMVRYNQADDRITTLRNYGI